MRARSGDRSTPPCWFGLHHSSGKTFHRLHASRAFYLQKTFPACELRSARKKSSSLIRTEGTTCWIRLELIRLDVAFGFFLRSATYSKRNQKCVRRIFFFLPTSIYESTRSAFVFVRNACNTFSLLSISISVFRYLIFLLYFGDA